jgi:pimeloyl-ACP methyl ester carboxylesterase/quercetin dioxygenase-like cupin family protein
MSGIASALLSGPALAYQQFAERVVKFSSARAEVSGTLLMPRTDSKVPCLVLLGGTLSQTRDGGMTNMALPPRHAMRSLAEELAAAGYATLRFDRVGYGESRAKKTWTGSYREESQVAAAAIRFARRQREASRVLVVGESAGAYLACLAAQDGVPADGYIFLGGLCSPAIEMYEYNFGRLVQYAERSPENMAWALEHARRDLALGRHYRELFEAAQAGHLEFEIVDGDYRTMQKLARRHEELEFPPDRMFRHIQAPVLALGGARDMNVPPSHPARIVQILHSIGNLNAVSLVIPSADHSFQRAADDPDTAWRERYTFESFRHPYASAMYRAIIAWLAQAAPSVIAPTNLARALPLRHRAVTAPELDGMTEFAPERLQFAPGVEIIEDVTNRSKTVGVDTLEGRIGPLLLAEQSQATFIEMPSGLYLDEHPHGSESIIYTASGRWVLCSQGRRRVMKPGSLFRFDANIPTGYEVPFPESATILIFKERRTTRAEKEFVEYLRGLADKLKKEQATGTPFLLKNLPADHPARVFAREINAGFEATP